jgi:hypothetical protein
MNRNAQKVLDVLETAKRSNEPLDMWQIADLTGYAYGTIGPALGMIRRTHGLREIPIPPAERTGRARKRFLLDPNAKVTR